MPVTLLSTPWRIVTGLLVATSLVTLPTYLVALLVLPPVPPIVMIRSFLLGTALPAAMAWGILRAFAGTADVADGVLRLRRRDLDVEVPGESIATVRPWWIPLPRPGLALRTAGGRLPVGMTLADPRALLDRLAAAGVNVAGAQRHPGVLRTAGRPEPRWHRPILKFAVLGSLPAAILFYTHQHIAYGGTFGQYYLEGPGPYFSTLAQYWATTVILLVSWASIWRAGAELVVWVIALAHAAWVPATRRLVEVVCALAYYGGVPLLLALRYLA